ncbi:hypothetical protein BDW74DRAFT_183967 [Aspergillus multicolor]|uniref:uncharacterized protein n=1 Tax=Aspergillus multicolor TaxID=41759 RepID=UPI003CCD33C0
MEPPRLGDETSSMLPASRADVERPEEPARIKRAYGRSKRWRINSIFALCVLVLGVVSLTLAIVHYSQQQGAEGGLTAPVTIGGRFTNIEAKAIDLVCAVVLAPLLMLALDYVWFNNVRVSVINEQSSGDSKGVPLPSLVEASNTSGGSFDLVKVRKLSRGRTWRLYMLSFLVLFSGAAGKLLANFIAYEAFDVETARSDFARLRY